MHPSAKTHRIVVGKDNVKWCIGIILDIMEKTEINIQRAIDKFSSKLREKENHTDILFYMINLAKLYKNIFKY